MITEGGGEEEGKVLGCPLLLDKREKPLRLVGGDACEGRVLYQACPPTALALGPKEDDVEKCDPIDNRRAPTFDLDAGTVLWGGIMEEGAKGWDEGAPRKDAKGEPPTLLPAVTKGGVLWEKASGEVRGKVPSAIHEGDGEEDKVARPELVCLAMRRRNPSTLASNRAAAVRCAGGGGEDGEVSEWRPLGSLAGATPRLCP
jgi:hypothetical protein